MTRLIAALLCCLALGCSPDPSEYQYGTRVKVGGCYPGIVIEVNRRKKNEYVVAWLDGVGQYHKQSVPTELLVIEAEKSE